MEKINPNTQSGYKALVGSSLAFSLMTVCVKQIDGRLPVSELVFIRAMISLILTRVMLRRSQISPWGKNKKLLFLRGLLGTGALFCIFKALELLPLAAATIIQYTYPTFTSLAAWIFLKEKIQKQIIFAVMLGWIGITFVIQPKWLITEGAQLPIGSVIIAVCGAVLTALAYISVRKLSKSEHALVIIHYFPLVSLPLTVPFLFYQYVNPMGLEWIWLLGIGVFTQIGQIGITRGLSLLPAANATSINYTQVLFAAILGIVIFSEQINLFVLLGAMFILGATLISVSTNQKIT